MTRFLGVPASESGTDDSGVNSATSPPPPAAAAAGGGIGGGASAGAEAGYALGSDADVEAPGGGGGDSDDGVASPPSLGRNSPRVRRYIKYDIRSMIYGACWTMKYEDDDTKMVCVI